MSDTEPTESDADIDAMITEIDVRPIAMRVTADGATQTPLTAEAVAKTVRRAKLRPSWKNHIVRTRGSKGTDTYGLYLEVVNTTAGHESHVRYFIVGQHVYAASRPKGASKANWQHRDGETLEAALTFIDGVLARPNIELFGRPLLVELAADDVSQIEEGIIPSARFRGLYRIEHDFGKYDFGGEIKSEPWPEDFPTATSA